MPKKSVLGRGLDALIPKSQLPEINIHDSTLKRDTGENGIIATIELERIQPNPFQPRTDFDQSSLEELANSIREKGIIQPVTVRRISSGYQLISGERRLRAAQMARLKAIPAYIINIATDEEMLELALVENIQRELLNPMEIAVAYQRLIDECHLSQDEIAKRVGKDRTTVTNFLRLLKLPQKIQEGLRKNKITTGHARALINLPNERTQLRLYEKIVAEGLSVRKVEDLVRNIGKHNAKSGSQAHRTENGGELEHLEGQLRELLGTKVRVQNKGDGKGEIIIEFYSLDDFERLFELFSAGNKRQ
ncbi:MAG TPA: ParB/RepB/Spo0J family partition protein [Bacteroidota bacterium]|nr:ParB/RepB/Spo0J family partition protein [Bacteroidota bacterium]